MRKFTIEELNTIQFQLFICSNMRFIKILKQPIESMSDLLFERNTSKLMNRFLGSLATIPAS
jgi:hypothetical protein